MNRLLYPILFCGLLCSCLLSHQRILDHAFVYDAIRVPAPGTYYQHSGKLYIAGQRIQITQRDPDYWWWHIKGSYTYYWKVVPGSEGEIVYREVTLVQENGEKLLLCTENGTWQQLRPAPARQYRADRLQLLGLHRWADETGKERIWSIDREKKLCSRALYALPAGVAAFVLVDIPVTASACSIAAAASVIALPATIPQQQPTSRENTTPAAAVIEKKATSDPALHDDE